MATYNDTIVAKQLYSCSATVDKRGLTSYRTHTVEISEDSIRMHLVHTSTTMQHVRKYVQYLTECGKDDMANIVDSLYRMCITHRAQDAMYDKASDRLTVMA